MARILLLISGILLSSNLLAAPEKIIYHLNTGRPDVQWKAITNLENLYLGSTEKEVKIKILLQGEGIDLINKENKNRDLGMRLAELINLGLEVEVGRNNYYQHRHILDLNNPPVLVNNIFSRIIELQKQGYQYVTP